MEDKKEVLPQFRMTRKEFLKYSGLVLAGIALGYIMRNIENIADIIDNLSWDYRVRPFRDYELKSDFRKAFSGFEEKQKEALLEELNDTSIVLDYRRNGTTFKFYLPEGIPAPSKKKLDAVYDYFDKYHRIHPPRHAIFFIINASETEAEDDALINFPFTRKSLMYPDASFSTSNMALDEIDQSSSFWVEFGQVMTFQGNRTFTSAFLEVLIEGDSAYKDKDYFETMNNSFGVAMYAASQGMTYQEYIEITKREGTVMFPERKIKLTPLSENRYKEIQAIASIP